MQLTTPEDLIKELPLSKEIRGQVERSRNEIASILEGKDRRLLLFIGPCSVHDKDETIEYASKLSSFAEKTKDKALIVMRAYIEKSRTALGWRGLARDPYLDGEKKTETGIREARNVIVNLAERMPIGIELVNPFFWQYWVDGISMASVGARGVESQSLREAAACLPCPCGFKNALDGEIESAVNAALSASKVSTVVILGRDGKVAEIESPGNPFVHVILRGGRDGPNWRKAPFTTALLKKAGLKPAILVDASHDNSGKNPKKQKSVVSGALRMRRSGIPIRGVMIESYLKFGRQNPAPKKLLTTGLSVTDACLGWEETEDLLSFIVSKC